MNLGALMALIIISLMLAVSLKARNPEVSAMISLAISICIIYLCIERIGTISNTLKKISNYVKLDNLYILVLIKLIGISYICEFASGISKDAGYGAVATQIELIGKLTMLLVSLPVLIQVIETVVEIL